jgi:hypothetical protein
VNQGKSAMPRQLPAVFHFLEMTSLVSFLPDNINLLPMRWPVLKPYENMFVLII